MPGAFPKGIKVSPVSLSLSLPLPFRHRGHGGADDDSPGGQDENIVAGAERALQTSE